MATTIRGLMRRQDVIGRWVYHYRDTSLLGRIVSLDPDDIHCTVAWAFHPGVAECTEVVNTLNDFQSLIDDHTKKIATHQQALDRAMQKLQEANERS
jgi:hypothetical protein